MGFNSAFKGLKILSCKTMENGSQESSDIEMRTLTQNNQSLRTLIPVPVDKYRKIF